MRLKSVQRSKPHPCHGCEHLVNSKCELLGEIVAAVLKMCQNRGYSLKNTLYARPRRGHNKEGAYWSSKDKFGHC